MYYKITKIMGNKNDRPEYTISVSMILNVIKINHGYLSWESAKEKILSVCTNDESTYESSDWSTDESSDWSTDNSSNESTDESTYECSYESTNESTDESPVPYKNCRMGQKMEPEIIKTFEKLTKFTVKSRQTRFSSVIQCRDFDIRVIGNIDGIVNDKIFEAKYRVDKLPLNPHDYDIFQVLLYMYMAKTNNAVLVEMSPDYIRINKITCNQKLTYVVNCVREIIQAVYDNRKYPGCFSKYKEICVIEKLYENSLEKI